MAASTNTCLGLDLESPKGHWDEWDTFKTRFLDYRFQTGLENKSVEEQVETLINCMDVDSERITSYLHKQRQLQPDLNNAHGDVFGRTLCDLDAYFSPINNHLYHSVVLSKRCQQSGESNHHYIKCVEELATKCLRWDKTMRDKMIRLRLLAGMSDQTLSVEIQHMEDCSIELVKEYMRQNDTLETKHKINTKMQQMNDSNHSTDGDPLHSEFLTPLQQVGGVQCCTIHTNMLSSMSMIKPRFVNTCIVLSIN